MSQQQQQQIEQMNGEQHPLSNEQRLQANNIMQLFNAKKSCSYEVLARNHFLLPNKKAAICTQKYLLELYEGICFAFRTDQLAVLNCVKPPPLKYLSMMAKVNLEKYIVIGMTHLAMPKQQSDSIKRLCEHLQYRSADSKFLITVLATLQVKHEIRCEIFDKDYSYVTNMYNMVDEDNENNFHYHSGGMKRSEQEFFSNLPALSTINAKAVNKMMPREQVLIEQLKKDNLKMKELQDRMHSCKAELQGDRKKQMRDIRPKTLKAEDAQKQIEAQYAKQLQEVNAQKRELESKLLVNASASLNFTQQQSSKLPVGSQNSKNRQDLTSSPKSNQVHAQHSVSAQRVNDKSLFFGTQGKNAGANHSGESPFAPRTSKFKLAGPLSGTKAIQQEGKGSDGENQSIRSGTLGNDSSKEGYHSAQEEGEDQQMQIN